MAKIQVLTPKQQGRRHRILSTAREMLTEYGYEGTVMSKVAERADVSPTTLYNLYNTKDELLLEALRELVVEAVTLTEQEVGERGYEFILRNLSHSATQSEAGPAYADAISQAVFRAKPADPLVKLMLITLSDTILISLSTMRRKRQLKEHVDIDELANALTGAFWSSFLLWMKGVIKLAELERSLQRGFMSILIAASRGAAREDIESRYDQLDR